MLIVDRIEGDIAVCESENDEFLHIPLAQIESGLQEGDLLLFENGLYRIDQAATQARKAHMQAKLRGLFQKRRE